MGSSLCYMPPVDLTVDRFDLRSLFFTFRKSTVNSTPSQGQCQISLHGSW